MILYLLCMTLAVAQMIDIPASATANSDFSAANLSVGVADRTIHCDELTYGRNIFTSDCKTAIELLPKDEPGDVRFDERMGQFVYPKFSRQSEELRHRLPISRAHESCVLQVRLGQDVDEDHSSWRIILLRVENVIKKCVTMTRGIGGSVLTGEAKGIEITVGSTTSSKDNMLLENESVANS